MKLTTRLASRGGILLLALTSSLSSLAAQETTPKPKQLPAAIVRKYDLDRDGILNEEEKAAWKADVQRGRLDAQTRRLEKYDANKDGKLDRGEKAAAVVESVKKPKADGKKAGTSSVNQDASLADLDSSSTSKGGTKKPR